MKGGLEKGCIVRDWAWEDNGKMVDIYIYIFKIMILRSKLIYCHK